MNCSSFQSLILDYLEGSIDPASRREVEGHLEKCPSCRLEIERIMPVWTMLIDIPEEEPSPLLQSRFETMLETYRHGMNHVPSRVSVTARLSRVLGLLWPKQPVFQFGIAMLCLIIGLVAGALMGKEPSGNGDVAELREEVREMRQTATLSLLQQQSATERLRGINMSSAVNSPDSLFLVAIIETLNSDQNVNVRLAAVDALYLFSDTSWIRDELVGSLTIQTSPLVQVALIDLLVEIRERKALDALKILLNNEENIEPVRERALKGIEQMS